MQVSKDSIVIEDLKDFNIKQILECGQIFRYKQDGDKYIVFSKDKKCEVIEKDGKAIIYTDDVDYFINFFDLNTDYSALKEKLKDLPFMNECIQKGYGIRILRQDKFEMIISFIISANNHIPRIKGIIERLSKHLGENMGDYYAFPKLDKMAVAGEDFYSQIGAGYRASYLDKTTKAILGGFDIYKLDNLSTDVARKKLCTLMGIGPKVADCILLFGYHRFDVFPVDTWIKKVYKDIFKKENSSTNIHKDFMKMYGDIAGLAQQYLFYTKREDL